jgi:hypothetical protein
MHFLRTFSWLFVTALLVAGHAHAQRESTLQAFERLEEDLRPRVEEGSLAPRGIGPILLVGATPAFEETQAWFPVATLEVVTRIFGPGNVRLCEACLNPRVYVKDGRMEHNTVLTLPEIMRLDAELRGKSAPARSAIFVEETPRGIAVRILAIQNGQVLFAGNFDEQQKERVDTASVYNATIDLGRRLRGESLTHIFMDVALVPNQHLSLDIVEQFGPYNQNLAGFTASLIDPFLGVGIVYYRVIPLFWNLTLGAQGLVSVPTGVANAFDGGDAGDIIDPLFTGVVVARMPIPSTSFGLVAMASTNLSFSFGISLMNISFLPIFP